jgi:P4 family phage/plasmid primase-like protien
MTLDEIMSKLAELREQQTACFLKMSSPEREGLNLPAKVRAIVAQAGDLDEIEIDTVTDEVLRKPALWEKSSSKIVKLWKAAKRKAKENITDDVIANAYKRQYQNARMFTRSRWYKWNGSGVWVDDCDVQDEIWRKMEQMKPLGVIPTAHKRRSVEECLQGRSRLGVKESEVDARGDLLNFTNGVYNLLDDELIAHSPALYLTTQLPFDYNPGAECPRWQTFLEQVIIDRAGRACPETIRFLQQAFGYSLTTETKYEVSFWLQGSGANGKSTLLNVLSAMSGTAAMALNLGMLEKERYQLAALAGIRVVTCAESPVGLMIADAVIKGLISGEPMNVRFPYGKPFELTPVCKIWWAMNNPPRVADTSDGFWRRVKVIPFRARFDTDKRKPDIELRDKLYQELPGIFNWSLAGLRDLRQNGWAQSPEIIEATGAYRESNDVEQAFIDSQCIVDPDARVSASDLYNAYRSWCSDTGHKAKSMTRVASDWVRLGLEKSRTENSIDYLGVGLLTEALPPW